MKKIYSISLIVLLAACAKAPVTDKEIVCNPIPVSVTASINMPEADPATKLSYTADGNTLKSTWKKGDQISLITYDKDFKLISNDILTAQGSGTSVRFTGTYSNPPSGVVDACLVYPALSGTPLASPLEDHNNYNTTGPFYVEDGLLRLDSGRQFVQNINGTYTNAVNNLPYYTLMHTSVLKTDVASGSFSASFSHLTYIIKATLTMPSTYPGGKDNAYQITKVELWAKESSPGVCATLKYYGPAGFNSCSFNGPQSIMLRTNLGALNDLGTPSGVIVGRSSTLVVYFVGGFGTVTENYRLLQNGGFIIKAFDSDYPDNPLTATLTVEAPTVYKPIELGRMYRISATLSY